jgi:magnesium chelatase subunit D
VELAASRLEELPTGGRTPLAAGIEKAAEVLERERLRDPRPQAPRRPPHRRAGDGRTGPALGRRGLRSLGAASFVVDTEEGYVRLGMAGDLARAMGASCLRLEELRAESLVDLVERRRVA